jgi:hypothetical protein
MSEVPLYRVHGKGPFDRRTLHLSLKTCPDDLISQTVLIKSFCKSQFLHKSVNLFFILVIMKDKLKDLCGN